MYPKVRWRGHGKCMAKREMQPEGRVRGTPVALNRSEWF